MFFDKQPELDTCYERRHPACEHDTSKSWRSTANKDFTNWKKMIIEFPARQWKWHVLFDLLQITASIGFAKGVSGSDQCRSEWTDSYIKSINDLNCSQDR